MRRDSSEDVVQENLISDSEMIDEDDLDEEVVSVNADGEQKKTEILIKCLRNGELIHYLKTFVFAKNTLYRQRVASKETRKRVVWFLLRFAFTHASAQLRQAATKAIRGFFFERLYFLLTYPFLTLQMIMIKSKS